MIATFDGASPCLAPFREAAAAFQRESWPVILASAGDVAQRIFGMALDRLRVTADEQSWWVTVGTTTRFTPEIVG